MSSSGIGNTSRDMTKDFTFDHSYWSVDSAEERYDSQEQVSSLELKQSVVNQGE